MLREVVEKEGGEAFTDEDEEILMLFASQAATAIANARTYRAERRARADLEALIETSPVGVVVFDVGTGRPASLNREARRIVEGLCNPGQSAEQLLEVITYRRAIPEPFVLGDLAIDYDRRRVTVAGREVELTATEYELLRALSLNAGRVTTSETLLNRVWSRSVACNVSSSAACSFKRLPPRPFRTILTSPRHAPAMVSSTSGT